MQGHVPPHGVASYYYYFGHYYGARTVSELNDDHKKAKLEGIIVREQNEEGSWIDATMYGDKNYATAMALITLKESSALKH
jgi:hypothetical protein